MTAAIWGRRDLGARLIAGRSARGLSEGSPPILVRLWRKAQAAGVDVSPEFLDALAERLPSVAPLNDAGPIRSDKQARAILHVVAVALASPQRSAPRPETVTRLAHYMTQTSSAHLQLAVVELYLKLGMHDECEALLGRIEPFLAKDKQQVRANRVKGELFVSRNDVSAGEACLRRALSLAEPSRQYGQSSAHSPFATSLRSRLAVLSTYPRGEGSPSESTGRRPPRSQWSMAPASPLTRFAG